MYHMVSHMPMPVGCGFWHTCILFIRSIFTYHLLTRVHIHCFEGKCRNFTTFLRVFKLANIVVIPVWDASVVCSAGMEGAQFMHQQQPASIIQPTVQIRGELSEKFLIVILMAECL